MIKDITLIRKELEGFSPVEMPYAFTKGCLIKYLYPHPKDNRPAMKKGYFYGKKNHCLVLTRTEPEEGREPNDDFLVRTCYKNPDGTTDWKKTKHLTFFICEEEENERNQGGGGKTKKKSSKAFKELKEMIVYQQGILDKLAERMKTVETDKARLTNENNELQEMLHENQLRFQSVVQRLKEAEAENIKYKEVIHNLIHSR